MQRQNLMVRVVKRRPDEIVHRGVNQEEVLFSGAFDVLDTGQEGASIAGNETSRFHQDSEAEWFEQGHQARGIFLWRQDIFGSRGFPPGGRTARQRRIVNNPKTASDAEELEVVLFF